MKLFSLIALDEDLPPNNVRTYTITTPSLEGCFLIENNWKFYARSRLYTPPCNSQYGYSINVTATDGGSPPLTSEPVTVQVNVLRNDNDPIFQNLPTTIELKEDIAAGSLIYTVTARDQDTNQGQFGDFMYSMGELTPNSYFQLDENTGVLTARPSLLVDTRTSYYLSFMVMDMEPIPHSSQQWLRVNINRNLFAPQHNQPTYTFDVTEDGNVGIVVGSIGEYNNDTKDPWNRFIFISHGSDAAGVFFELDNVGVIRVINRLYDEQNRNIGTYRLNAFLRDKNGAADRFTSTSALVTINVIRNSECPISSNLPARSSIHEWATTTDLLDPSQFVVDGDPQNSIFGTHTYRLIGDGAAAVLFTVNPATGTIRTITNLFADRGTSYILRVEVADSGPSSCTATFTVDVNHNLNTPFWVNPVAGTTNQFIFTISETQPVSQTFSSIVARDNDNKGSLQ